MRAAKRRAHDLQDIISIATYGSGIVITEQPDMPQIIETTSNQLFRVIEDRRAQYDCIPVKRTKDGYVDKAKARHMLINKQFIWKVHA